MIESDKDRMARQEQDIYSLRQNVEGWKSRALAAEEEVRERKCAMDFAERLAGHKLTDNA